MKSVVKKSLHKSFSSQTRGWRFRLQIVGISAVCFLATWNPLQANAGSAITQLKYLQTLAQLTGDSDLFSAGSTAEDYAQWARNKGMDPSGGWNTKSKLSSDVIAQSLVQLLGLNPRQFGGDYYRVLEREGIVIQRNTSVSGEDLAALIDNPVVGLKTFQVAQQSSSPNKPANGQGFGFGLGHNPNGIPPFPPGNPNPNPSDPQRTGNPHVPR